MRIHTSTSSRFYGSQIQRIEDGFRALGHELTDYPADSSLIFVNNPPFHQVINDATIGENWRGKVIFGVQDIPHHIPNYDIAGLKSQLSHADAITSISETTRRDLLAATGLDSHVIYQPIMPVTRTRERKHPFKVLFIGRVGDPNKRVHLAAQAFAYLGFRAEEIVTVGNQPPWYGGVYWGVAAESALHDLYNSVDFVVCTGRNEGMCLPMIESMAAGAIPVVCSDLATREEFLPSTTFSEYLDVTPDVNGVIRFIARFMQDNDAKVEMQERLHAHFCANWADRVSGVGVARRILETYESIL